MANVNVECDPVFFFFKAIHKYKYIHLPGIRTLTLQPGGSCVGLSAIAEQVHLELQASYHSKGNSTFTFLAPNKYSINERLVLPVFVIFLIYLGKMKGH